jgi:hypothetical protein
MYHTRQECQKKLTNAEVRAEKGKENKTKQEREKRGKERREKENKRL